MKVYFDQEPSVYDKSGLELRIRWGIRQVSAPSMDDEPRTQWECNEALCSIYDNRAQLIEKIIGAVHDTGAEIALINNRDTKPDDYAAYQAFRAEAKTLADGWLNQ
jgi:hypothetical protein